ncbi:MAG: type IV pilus assembly protein PilM [bacterium]|jgi:type IV pilus assembly protein PilM
MSFFSKILGHQNRYTGVDIGTDSIKMVEIETTKNGLRLVNIGVENTPAEAIEASIITDSQSIGEALIRLISREGFSRSSAVSSLAGQALITRLIEVPHMGDAELAEAMKWEVERYIPFPAKEVVLDFKSLPTEDLEATQMEVLLVAAKKEMVNNHIAALNRARLDLVAIDIEPLALSRALIDVYKHSDNETPVNIMLVNIGASLTDITIIKDGNIGFNRGIPTGGNNITQAISNFLLVSADEAEQIKLMQTIIPKQDVVIEADEIGETLSSVEPLTETVDDYNRVLNNVDSGTDTGGDKSSNATGEASNAEAPDASNKMLDLTSFLTQNIESNDEAPIAEELAPSQDKQSDSEYQGLSLEALYGIESLDLGTEKSADTATSADTDVDNKAEAVQEAERDRSSSDASLSVVKDKLAETVDNASKCEQEKLMEAIRPSLQEIVNEIRRSLDYFRSRIKDSGNIDRIIISGGVSRLKNIDNFLEVELGIPAEIANPFSMIDTSAFDKKYIDEAAPVFAIAVGLAIREFLNK